MGRKELRAKLDAIRKDAIETGTAIWPEKPPIVTAEEVEKLQEDERNSETQDVIRTYESVKNNIDLRHAIEEAVELGKTKRPESTNRAKLWDSIRIAERVIEQAESVGTLNETYDHHIRELHIKVLKLIMIDI